MRFFPESSQIKQNLHKNECDTQPEYLFYSSVSFPGDKIERIKAHDDFFPFFVKILWILENYE